MTRKFWPSVLVAAALGSPALAALHEKLAAVPKGWSAVGAASESTTTTFTLALNQKFDLLDASLLAVSTPGSPLYGKHWSKAAVDLVFNPGDDIISAVLLWLKNHGVQHYNVDGPFVDFAADIKTANELFDADYQYYKSDGVTKLRTLRYSIPDDLADKIALVTPGTYFGKTKAQRATPRFKPTTTVPRDDTPTISGIDPACQTSITPACFRVMYNVGDYKADPKSGSKVSIGSFLNESALFRDLYQFEDVNKIPRQSFTKVSIANGTVSQDVNDTIIDIGEANLDVQMIVGVAPGVPLTEFSTGGSPPFIPTYGQPTPADNGNEPYVPHFRYLLSLKDGVLPQVHSISYGDQEDGVPLKYAQYACHQIGLLGLRGVSVLSSSGDGGLGGACLAPDFKTVEFGSNFPAACPYITAVGGTQAVTPEIAWNESSGGFSKYFAQPSWQRKAIQGYTQNHVSPETYKYYSQYTNFTTGRGYPDISTHSLDPDFQVVYDGELSPSGGTSASSPLFGGIVSLLNDARLRAGKPVLGWLNPLIYSLGNDHGAIVDITGGYTVGCSGKNNGTGKVPGARWNATQGWDPTTGWGIPDFQRFKDAVLKL